MPITCEDRLDYVTKVSALSLWAASHMCKESEGFGDFLTLRTPLYRLTTLWDGSTHPARGDADEDWDRLLDELASLRESHEDEKFEAQGIELLRPFLESRVEKDVNAWPHIPSAWGTYLKKDSVFGFFLYEFAGDPRGERHVELHMANTMAPESPFADMKTRVSELRTLLDHALNRTGDVSIIRTTSWLNSFGPFLALFPASWCDRVSGPTELKYTYDWWGQFMTRTGAFHERNGRKLRESGKIPYDSLTRECRIDELIKYLER